MPLFKYLVVAASATLATLLIVTTSGTAAHKSDSHQTTSITARPGDTVTFRGAGVSCFYGRPSVGCYRGVPTSSKNPTVLFTRRKAAVYLRPSDTAHFGGVDLFCTLHSSDPDHREVGPEVYCIRESTEPANSRAIQISRYHYKVTDATGSYYVYTAGRTP
jgi:hypothetical protein